MNKEELVKIVKNFRINGEIIDTQMCDSGHINKTYVITCKDENEKKNKYILQYVNTHVFQNLSNLMSNIDKVTEYMIKNAKENGERTYRVTIKLINTIKGSNSFIYNNWRMEEFIDNTKTYLTANDLNTIKEAGRAVGKFQRYLNGFPVEELYEVIPKFHYTPYRIEQLKEALTNKENLRERKERFEDSKSIIEYVIDNNRINKASIITDKIANKKIPLRVTHNDTKISNILFDKETEKAVCLIDLDTVMPGSLAYDFGEGLRTGITLSNEDEQDLSKIILDMDRFENYTEGFLSELKGIITKEELEILPLGVWMMTYENAIRFLADYLNGDVYFKTDKNIQDHNLIRAKAQIELLRQIEEQQGKMSEIISKYEV